ncbi:MAG: porin family protein [Methylobacteriaceae bacterium]|nr:porin family protein [Methylobacteriaceae bacterium]
MFKKILMGSLAAATMTASAYAADLPARMAPPPPPPVPVCIWCGFYLGVNGGGAFTRTQALPYIETFPGAGITFSSPDMGPLPSRSGGFGGGQAGINWQWGMFVAGAELDAEAIRLNSNVATTVATPLIRTIASTQRIDYFGTARGRVGIAFGGPGWNWGWGSSGFGGSVLVYATGGFAYAGVRDGFTYVDSAGFSAVNFGNNGRTGFSAGGGVEWKFLPNWSIKGEYQYIGLRQGPVAAANEFVAGVGTAFVISRRDPRVEMHTARIGLNYHFSLAAPAPVVARY